MNPYGKGAVMVLDSMSLWVNETNQFFKIQDGHVTRIPMGSSRQVAINVTGASLAIENMITPEMTQTLQRFVPAPEYKPKKGKQDKFSRLQAIHHGINSKRKKPK